ncbi:hypothetical protein B0A61_15005 [Flavobacterium aquatile LMG 4008 = ATCC 11947]|uniref:Uncharacterized protein n=1 Tax=Flavobacterium aquatile LMG 4008 = ATCC 11947 TaxID=1453498 RepID=A0A095TYX7_9FLAO|nr:hypothetical protein LG45_10505 [Flavobacterium aquatile LMG 4008 = ATCC 11947]OXA65505.1 hypothetical protein B0A61_15005 [Flavobacterium aquatile LMG 4008 = ATCC 11947]GEC80115.1 hypothetical protein FAQ01_29850 [Flavobacterium aquatile]
MVAIETKNDIVYFDKKIGYITHNQLIITKGSKKNKIYINSIKRVNLFKSRVLLSNLICFLTSTSLLLYVYLYLKSNKNITFYSLIVTGIVLLVYSFIHKFYIYKLVIKENNDAVVEIKTTQIYRDQIKDFYKTILNKIPKT